ncbi:TPA: antirestriction protein [Yersinia enterocolitica]|uniref:antirestriction protein n=1 Tax=Yersinia enterocolitica TaxID=630 RepID=UPI0032FCEAEF|nr:antirestriction protein [Yersinia enterocolitica]EKN4808909.1 antirestriction protein [Yersinia enterocolitica]EKN5154795.1 antirestriction protein [Yersinia enterocolitica]HDL7328620.1 antirestriction protein [Yersinia enterocolitica]HDL7355395.1 antirestriction protein [Yersinia enterocolitica]
MNIPTTTQMDTLTATPVTDSQRIHFWPDHFGKIPQWILIEPQVFGWLDRLCDDYRGDFWNYYTLSDGGAFMVPGTEQDYALFNELNGNGATVSREAAGITACLMTYSHHACRTENEFMTEHFYRLRAYALHHPESHAIFALID